MCCGVKTNIVTTVRILDKAAANCPQFAPLVNATAQNFTINEVDRQEPLPCQFLDFTASFSVSKYSTTSAIP